MHDLDLKSAKLVLQEEANAILAAAQRLDQNFTLALDLIYKSRGRVILCGMGKSGHIARKIAASFSSTGTAAYFLHPSEALHGDSGVLLSTDCLLMIAQSGQTPEIIKLAQLAKNKCIPILAITGNLESELASLATVCLSSFVHREADPFGVVPTCSSTVALSLGDALVVGAMKKKNFELKDFAHLHPEGALGKKLKPAHQAMCDARLICINPEADFATILSTITKANFGIAAVVNNNMQVLGVITDGDLRRALLNFESRLFSMKAKEWMTPNPKTISPHVLCQEAIEKMLTMKITTLLVCEPTSDKLLGLLRLQDIGL